MLVSLTAKSVLYSSLLSPQPLRPTYHRMGNKYVKERQLRFISHQMTYQKRPRAKLVV